MRIAYPVSSSLCRIGAAKRVSHITRAVKPPPRKPKTGGGGNGNNDDYGNDEIPDVINNNGRHVIDLNKTFYSASTLSSEDVARIMVQKWGKPFTVGSVESVGHLAAGAA